MFRAIPLRFQAKTYVSVSREKTRNACSNYPAAFVRRVARKNTVSRRTLFSGRRLIFALRRLGRKLRQSAALLVLGYNDNYRELSL